MATTPLDMRLDKEVKARVEKAAILLGHKSLTEYLVNIMDENATQAIAQYEIVTVENNVFDLFLDA